MTRIDTSSVVSSSFTSSRSLRSRRGVAFKAKLRAVLYAAILPHDVPRVREPDGYAHTVSPVAQLGVIS